MPRKLRNPKRRIEGVSETALWVMGDRVLYPEPQEPDRWELLDLDYPTTAWEKCKALWESARDELLHDWIRAYPGTRPNFWWLFSAPRMTAEDLERNGWTGTFFADRLPNPRLRLGGIGMAAHDVRPHVPEFELGIPESWEDDIDPADPPRFEAQAAYLRRHNLLLAEEARRLLPSKQ